MVTFGQLPSCYFQKTSSTIIMKVDILRVDILESNFDDIISKWRPNKLSGTVRPFDMVQWDNPTLGHVPVG